MGRIIAFVACLVITLTLPGCSRNKPPTPDPLLASRWLLTSFSDANGSRPVPTDPIPYLEVEKERLLFHNGCNGVGTFSRIRNLPCPG